MRRAAVALVLVAVVGASCASTSTTHPSALDDLTTFFTAAAGVDQKLKAAAVDANGSIGTTEITISQSTLDAIAAADPTSAGRDIPTGLPPAVLLPVLTVQSDLMSRYFAFRGFVQARAGTIPAWDGDIGGLLFTATYTAVQGWAVQLNAC